MKTKIGMREVRKVLRKLINGKTIEINGHTIFPPDGGFAITITDPYGIDSFHSFDLTLSECKRALSACYSKPSHDSYYEV